MTHTQDFEHVLELDNVVGVEYDEDSDRVVAFVTQKQTKGCLGEDQVVANNVDRDSDVIEVGEVEALHVPEAQGDRHARHRPVEGGVSEINANSTAATAGPYPAKVVDTSKGDWSDEHVAEGDLVRLSNNHVYARVDKAGWGEPIVQPSTADGGDLVDDKVGVLCGKVPIEDGVTVDLAARTVDESQESEGYHGLPDGYPSGVRREYSGLRSARTIKTGRTTGVTEGDIKATTATIRVNYGEGGVIRLRDQIVTTDMSKGGDSGSPLFLNDSKELLGEIYAGSDKVSIAYKASNMESELGVELMTDNNDDGGPSKTFHLSLETTVSIAMEPPDLDLESLSGDQPKPGETVEVEATFVGDVPGNAWVEAQGKRLEFSLDEDGQRTLTIPLTAPEEPAESFDVDITGGYVL